MGDPIFWGTGVGDKETGAYLLDRKLSRFQVLNLGVGGYSIDQYYILLKNELSKLRPLLIIANIYLGKDFFGMLSQTTYGYEKPLFL